MEKTTLIKERINLYVCQYGCHTVTVDVDEGTTPYMIPCQFTGSATRPANKKLMKDGKCIGTAKSCMYPRILPEGVPYPVPMFEWYLPTLSELSKLTGETDIVKLAELYKNGTLNIRPRTNAPMLLHKENE